MDNSERIRKWREERQKLAEQERLERVQVAEQERQERVKAAHEQREQRAEEFRAQREEALRAKGEEIAEAERIKRAKLLEELPSQDSIERAKLLLLDRRKQSSRFLLKRLALFFALPAFIVSMYFLLISSRFYEAEATFTVQSSMDQGQLAPGGLMAIAGVNTGMSDAFKVREFMLSRQMMELMAKKHAFLSHFSDSSTDWLSRFDSIFGLNSDPYRYYLSKVRVSVDIQEGLLRLYVQGRDQATAVQFSQAILKFSEAHVNELSERIRADQIAALTEDTKIAEQELLAFRQRLSSVQSKHKDIAPQETTAGIYQLISSIEAQIAEAESERDGLIRNGLDRSPVIPRLEAKISSLKKQIEDQRSRLVSSSSPKTMQRSLFDYEDVALRKELAQARWDSALRTLEQAKLQVLRERRYFMVVSEPSSIVDTSVWSIAAKIAFFLLVLILVYIASAVVVTLRQLRE